MRSASRKRFHRRMRLRRTACKTFTTRDLCSTKRTLTAQLARQCTNKHSTSIQSTHSWLLRRAATHTTLWAGQCTQWVVHLRRNMSTILQMCHATMTATSISTCPSLSRTRKAHTSPAKSMRQRQSWIRISSVKNRSEQGEALYNIDGMFLYYFCLCRKGR